MAARSGSHDRRGYDGAMQVFMVLIPCSLLLMIFYNWKIGLAVGMFCCITFITLEAISAPPDNNPITFMQWVRTQDRRRPVLLCLGDSLTHGKVGASFTLEIPYKLAQELGLPIPDYGKTFADPIWVVNGGQNDITSHTILHERLNTGLGCFPDYVFILIGTNDVIAMYKKSWKRDIMKVNELPEEPTIPVYERNLSGIVKFIQEATPNTQIGICTLPPVGEDLKSKANELVRAANEAIERVVNNAGDKVTLIPLFHEIEVVLEKKKRGWSLPVEFWFFAVIIQAPLFVMMTSIFSWNTLSKPFGFHLMTDGIHLNENGRDILVNLIVQWLSNKNVAKAIAVKS